ISSQPVIDPALNVPDDPPPHLVNDDPPPRHKSHKARKPRASEVVQPYVPPPAVTTVVGRVLEADGAPRAGVEVSFLHDRRTKVQTDAEGRFRFDLNQVDLARICFGDPRVDCLIADAPDREPMQTSTLLLLPGEVEVGDLRLLPSADLS